MVVLAPIIYSPSVDRRVYLGAGRGNGSGFALVGDQAIDRVVVESIGKPRPCFLENHGVVTTGRNATPALEAAVMTEDVAATVWVALRISTPDLFRRKMPKSCMIATQTPMDN